MHYAWRIVGGNFFQDLNAAKPGAQSSALNLKFLKQPGVRPRSREEITILPPDGGRLSILTGKRTLPESEGYTQTKSRINSFLPEYQLY